MSAWHGTGLVTVHGLGRYLISKGVLLILLRNTDIIIRVQPMIWIRINVLLSPAASGADAALMQCGVSCWRLWITPGWSGSGGDNLKASRRGAPLSAWGQGMCCSTG
jgi:hypothetical protein